MLGHPAVDVVVGDIRPQVLHAGPSLLRLHLQRLPQRAGESLRIVRVDRNCPWQLVTRTGQLAERSEEHTSELQSQFHLVCRLLLEKKKKKKYINVNYHDR